MMRHICTIIGGWFLIAPFFVAVFLKPPGLTLQDAIPLFLFAIGLILLGKR